MDINELEKPLPIINEALKLSLYVSASIGVLITLIYCGHIDYYPTGITAGDTIFFIAATLGFSFLYILIVFFIHSIGVLISPIFKLIQEPAIKAYCKLRKLDPEKENEIPRINFRKLRLDDFQTIFVGTIGLALIFILYFKNAEKAFELTTCAIAMAFIFGLWNTQTTIEIEKPERTKTKKIGLIVLALITPLILNHSNIDIINQSMAIIGVRHDNATVSLDKKHQEFLHKNGIYGKNGLYIGVKVLFRGIGNNVVIQIEHLQLAIPIEEIIVGIPYSPTKNEDDENTD